MGVVARMLARRREIARLVAGCVAGAALLWAGLTVHEGMSAAGEVAVARLAGTAADTVVAEWMRMLRAEEPPVAPSGEVFRWTTAEADARLDDPVSSDASAPASSASTPSAAATLLAEAERRELVLGDPAAALELVLEALDKEPDGALLSELLLRALQLSAHLGRADVVATSWARLRDLPAAGAIRPGSMPAWLRGWLALPADMQQAERQGLRLSATAIEKLFQDEDRLTLGPPEAPEARFELAPMLDLICQRLQHAPLPPDAPLTDTLRPGSAGALRMEQFDALAYTHAIEQRRIAALRRVGALPGRAVDQDRWTELELAGRSFFVRRTGGGLTGFFYAPRDLERALGERSGLPEGFAVDLAGDDESLGTVVRSRTELPGTTHAFTLRHADPQSIARAESTRMRLLRGAFVVLAILFVRGGWRSARVLARERRLAQLKSAFIAGVSHDLRTPVASILLLAENLESGAAERSGRDRYHAALRREAVRLRRLVDDVLDFSRLERGESPRLEREPVELARFADGLEADFRARVEEAGRTFASERGALPATVALDEHAVRRALENLLDNALKHGRGAVRLACAAGEGRLRLSVSDEGPGVPDGDRERVFEPFERLAAANGHVGGTGLGLAIVRAIARAHGGEARVRAAEAGAGAVFELDLPLEPTEDEEA